MSNLNNSSIKATHDQIGYLINFQINYRIYFMNNIAFRFSNFIEELMFYNVELMSSKASRAYPGLVRI